MDHEWISYLVMCGEIEDSCEVFLVKCGGEGWYVIGD
jgi:hypothetical protein